MVISPPRVIRSWSVLQLFHRTLHLCWRQLVLVGLCLMDLWQPIKFLGTGTCGVHLSVSSFIPPSALMYFSSDISLFFCFVVGSVGMILYVPWFNNYSAFFMYSSLSITTKHTPLSAVRTTLMLSSLNSLRVFCSSLVMFGLGG